LKLSCVIFVTSGCNRSWMDSKHGMRRN